MMQTIITPPGNLLKINFHELWEYRELLYNFVKRDIKVRYKQTLLGFLWVVLQPLFMMVIFTLLFGGIIKLSSDGVPYHLFCLSAIIPWVLFSEGLTRSTSCMISNAGIITKVYFPRIILPIASVISPIVDFIIGFGILMAMVLYYGFIPTIMIIPFIILTLISSFTFGVWLSALNVKNRDFQYTLPFLLQIGLYISPIVYSASIIPEQFRFIYSLNPMVGIIEGFRWCIFGTAPPGPSIFLSIGVMILFLIGGLFYFKRMETYYADVV